MRRILLVPLVVAAFGFGAAAPAGATVKPASAPSVFTGYVLAASDGGVFAYGRAFEGSAARLRLNRPIVGVASTPSAKGYWLVASDGGVFSYGDAHFYGSTGAIRLNKPIVGMTATPDGHGYWLVASDGGVFAFGDAWFHGSLAGRHVLGSTVGIARTASGLGYDILTDTGEVFAFGDALAPGDPPAVQFPVSTTSSYTAIVRIEGTQFGYVVVTGDATQRFGGDTDDCVAVTKPLIGQKPFVGVAGSCEGIAPGRPASQCGHWLVSSTGEIVAVLVAAEGSPAGLHLAAPIVGISA